MQGAAQTADMEPAGGSVLLRHVRAAARRRAAADPAPVAAAAPPPAAAPRSPDRAVANAIARAAERVHGMPLFFDRIDIGHAAVAELAELLPEQPLISVVEGPGDALGVVAICPGLLTSVIEMQAVGRISPRPASTRRPTRTDGAICADFLNACLAELGAELATLTGFRGLHGYRYASFLDDPRPLELMLDDVAYRRFSIRLRAGAAGQRDGQMLILLPALPQPVHAALPNGEAEDEGASPATPGAAGVAPPPGSLSAAVQAAPITLYGVLCRRTISLGELRALAPGALVALPPDVLSGATLETATGQQLLRGKFGELGGRHALRIAGGEAPAAASGFLGATGGGGGNGDGTGDAGGYDLSNSDALADAAMGAAPLDLSAPDPFRPDAMVELAPSGWGDQAPDADSTVESGAMTLDFGSDLSAWEDAEPVPLAPLSIG